MTVQRWNDNSDRGEQRHQGFTANGGIVHLNQEPGGHWSMMHEARVGQGEARHFPEGKEFWLHGSLDPAAARREAGRLAAGGQSNPSVSHPKPEPGTWKAYDDPWGDPHKQPSATTRAHMNPARWR